MFHLAECSSGTERFAEVANDAEGVLILKEPGVIKTKIKTVRQV